MPRRISSIGGKGTACCYKTRSHFTTDCALPFLWRAALNGRYAACSGGAAFNQTDGSSRGSLTVSKLERPESEGKKWNVRRSVSSD